MMATPAKTSPSGTPIRNEAVKAYFEETVKFYELFWHGGTGALHFGLGAPGVSGHRAELLNTNRVLADGAGIRSGDRVLDAGCGVGGSAIWLAQQRGALVLGTTLSRRQARVARERAARAGVAHLVQFEVRDFLDTGLDDASFDVVWALESSCYAEDKLVFLREARRLLRRDGRLVVGDGFLARTPRGYVEQWMYSTFRRGLALPDLARLDEFVDAVRGAGFETIRAEDRIDQVRRSSRRLFWRCLATYPLAALARTARLISRGLLENSRAGIVIHPMVRRGLMSYGVVHANVAAAG